MSDGTPSQPRGSFFELVRALEAAAPDATPLGGVGPVGAEAVRLRAHASLGFAARDVHAIDEIPAPGGARTRLTVTFHGLYGPDSPLPPHDTEAVLRDEDDTARDFLDLFNHRALALRYRAWARPRPHVSGKAWASSPVGRVLTGLTDPLGVGPSAWDTAALRWAGARTAAGLAALIGRFVPQAKVEVLGCVPQQVAIPDDQRLRLGVASSTLGVDTVLGGAVWDATGRLRIQIGPVDRTTFDALTPDSDLHRKITAAVGAWLDTPLSWSLVVLLAAEQVRPLQLGRTARLGVDAWLGQPQRPTVATELRPHVSGGAQ